MPTAVLPVPTGDSMIALPSTPLSSSKAIFWPSRITRWRSYGNDPMRSRFFIWIFPLMVRWFVLKELLFHPFGLVSQETHPGTVGGRILVLPPHTLVGSAPVGRTKPD